MSKTVLIAHAHPEPTSFTRTLVNVADATLAAAVMKGWIDRVWAYGLAYGHRGAGNRHRYGEGGFQGRRAMVSVTTGGPAADYAPRGINGPLDHLLFPITHGTLFFPGMAVLRTHAVYDTGRLSPEGVEGAVAAWRERLKGVFDEEPIRYRTQNGGDFPDGHVLADAVAPGRSGFDIHIEDETAIPR